MSALTTSDKAYVELVNEFINTFKSAEAQNLTRYHAFGQLVNTFLAAERGRYGERDIAHLAEDLQQKGVIDEDANAIRFLYWAKAVYTVYPDPKVLIEMSKKGFTVTHAKLIYSLDDNVRAQIEPELLEDGAFISTRELADKINSLTRLEAAGTAAAAVEEINKGKAARPPAPDFVAEDDPPPVIPDDDDTPEESAEAEEDEGVPAAANEPRTVDAVPSSPSPLKTLNSMDKILTHISTEAANVLIVIKEKQKRGFDSDRAEKKFKEYRSNVREGLRSAIPVLQALLTEILEDDA